MNIRYTIGMLIACLVVTHNHAMQLEGIDWFGPHQLPELEGVSLAGRCLEHAGLGFSQGVVAALSSDTPVVGLPIMVGLNLATYPLWQRFKGYTDFHAIGAIDNGDLNVTRVSQFTASYAGYFLVVYVRNALKDAFCESFE